MLNCCLLLYKYQSAITYGCPYWKVTALITVYLHFYMTDQQYYTSGYMHGKYFAMWNGWSNKKHHLTLTPWIGIRILAEACVFQDFCIVLHAWNDRAWVALYLSLFNPSMPCMCVAQTVRGLLWWRTEQWKKRNGLHLLYAGPRCGGWIPSAPLWPFGTMRLLTSFNLYTLVQKIQWI